MKIRIYRDPQESETIGDALMTAFNEQESEATPDIKSEEVKTESTPESKTKFAWGDEDRRKSRQELKDDDEIDLGYEDEVDGKKSPAKAKLAQVREAAKFLRENNQTINAALGMKKEFAANPKLGEAFTKFWAKAYADNKYNPEAVDQMVGFLEGKADATKEKILDASDDIKEMETLLEELDSDSPQAKILRQNINGLKNTRAQLKEALGTIKELQTKTGEGEKFRTSFEETQKKQKEEADAKQAGEIFSAEFGALTAKDRKDGYHIEDAEDAEELEGMVRDRVATLAAQGKINNDAEFKAAINESVKAAHAKIRAREEKYTNKYIRSKGGKIEEKPKEVKKDDSEPEQSLGQMMAEGMFGKG